MINSFRGNYYFLSNFYRIPVTYLGITYGSNEAAFQAQKTTNQKDRLRISKLDPSEAKDFGGHVKLRPDWESVKINIMYEICKEKFKQNPELIQKLIATGNTPLEEGNTWGDTFWGTVNGIGENHLGIILMKIREELINKTPLSFINTILVSYRSLGENISANSFVNFINTSFKEARAIALPFNRLLVAYEDNGENYATVLSITSDNNTILVGSAHLIGYTNVITSLASLEDNRFLISYNYGVETTTSILHVIGNIITVM